MTGLLERIDARLERIEARLAKCGPAPEEVAPGQPIDQQHSALGRRRHCKIVRRLMAAGDPRAFKVGRKYLLTPEAHAEALARVSLTPAPANDASREHATGTYAAALRKALGADK